MRETHKSETAGARRAATPLAHPFEPSPAPRRGSSSHRAAAACGDAPWVEPSPSPLVAIQADVSSPHRPACRDPSRCVEPSPRRGCPWRRTLGRALTEPACRDPHWVEPSPRRGCLWRRTLGRALTEPACRDPHWVEPSPRRRVPTEQRSSFRCARFFCHACWIAPSPRRRISAKRRSSSRGASLSHRSLVELSHRVVAVGAAGWVEPSPRRGCWRRRLG
jgi:hypothetical protein